MGANTHKEARIHSLSTGRCGSLIRRPGSPSRRGNGVAPIAPTPRALPNCQPLPRAVAAVGCKRAGVFRDCCHTARPPPPGEKSRRPERSEAKSRNLFCRCIPQRGPSTSRRAPLGTTEMESRTVQRCFAQPVGTPTFSRPTIQNPATPPRRNRRRRWRRISRCPTRCETGKMPMASASKALCSGISGHTLHQGKTVVPSRRFAAWRHPPAVGARAGEGGGLRGKRRSDGVASLRG